MSAVSPRRTLDQQRAAFAWEKVKEAKSEGNKNRGDKKSFDFSAYTNLAKSAPSLVMSNGLMATLAFFEQKSGEAKALNRALCAWLKERMPGRFQDPGYSSIMEGLHGLPSPDYLRATEEVLELLRWIRQFAPTLKG